MLLLWTRSPYSPALFTRMVVRSQAEAQLKGGNMFKKMGNMYISPKRVDAIDRFR